MLHPWRETGMHWRRQAPVGPYVVDSVCKKRKLIVEIDGDSHYFDQAIARMRLERRFWRPGRSRAAVQQCGCVGECGGRVRGAARDFERGKRLAQIRLLFPILQTGTAVM
ncbi:DUF559 domain-containing protein [Devosia chinhatensis]|uniref:DUF559 domain-containing protein n=1 Tax=Devosia aurantiaca TaxID=2714858 RepID=A0A6M1SZZ6_9HYPH|nr:DUF559 domain-containing protein [Devosia aurantiaca]